MKKILIFSTAYLPLAGGAELAVKEITDRISDFQFDLITLRFNKQWPEFERIGNINVHRVGGPKLLFPFFALFKAGKIPCDLIWSVMANRAGFAALFFKFFYPRTKFLLTLQEGDPFDYPKKQMGALWLFLKPLFRAIFTKADYIQAISNYLADWAKEMGAKNVEVVPNGVNVEKFKSQISNLKSNDDKILITVSRLVKKNAVGDIIEALKFLPENIKLWIIGNGPKEKNLKSQISNLKINDRVKFFGEVSQNDLPKYLSQADIFVRPSLSEGLGTAFLEAMAVGLPVIATRVGGIPDFLKDNETGLFCEINNPKSIAEKVKILLENEGLRNKIITNAKKMVIENYDWDLIAGKMKKIFKKLCAF
ncbi:MAG: glycosyltransferase family 4 protein [Candidatus Parcubacteria bacterium]|nr:glycosyltransferase family 4 protein [Candidatus Parcubacteria bacterium]